MRLATCVVAVIGFIGTSAFAEDVAVEAPLAVAPEPADIGASLGKVKTDLNAALASVTVSPGNLTTPGFRAPNRVYPSGFMGGNQIGYSTYVTGGGLADGKVDWTLGAGLKYKLH